MERQTAEHTEEHTAERKLNEWIGKIHPIDRAVIDASQRRWNSIAKPLHSLGKLEEHVMKIAGLTGKVSVSIGKKALIIMCADNGVVAEGVTQTGQEVTAIVAENFLTCNSSAAIMCEKAGADIFPIDIGMATDTKVPDYKIAYGTKNLRKEPAMTREEAARAVLTGIELVKEKKEAGYELIATGEMGIGNTTTSSAVVSVLLDEQVELMTGRGAGLSDAGLEKKKRAVSMAVGRFYETYPQYRGGTKEDYENGALSAVTVLSELGGFDLAGMTGLFLGGAAAGLPVLMDGFLSTVSALLAVLIRREAKDYLFASHISREPAGKSVLEMLGLPAPLHLGMHLGEGSGAVAMIPLLKMGASVYEEMSTFSDISVEQYVDYEKEVRT